MISHILKANTAYCFRVVLNLQKYGQKNQKTNKLQSPHKPPIDLYKQMTLNNTLAIFK